jgi:hypothetical protein
MELYLLKIDEKIGHSFETMYQLIKEVENIGVTHELLTRVEVLTLNKNTVSGCYSFCQSGAYLYLKSDPEKKIQTPGIKQKLDAESIKKTQTELINNSPQNVQPIKTDEKLQAENFLLMRDNDAQEKSFDDIQKEVSKMSLDEIKKISLYHFPTKFLYKYSPEKMLFVSKDDTIQLPYNLTEHLICTYTMLIISVEDQNNPFKLTKKYMCEKKVLIQTNEYEEMQQYRRGQLIDHGGEFKFDGLCKGHLVRIFLIKNKIIIGEINEFGVFYKNCFKEHLGRGEFMKCQDAIEAYICYVCDFRTKPFEEIKKIYQQKVTAAAALKVPDTADGMINFLIKANELEMIL